MTESAKTKQMTYMEHVMELRNRLLFVTLSVFVLSIIGYYIYPMILSSVSNIINEDLYATQISEGFITRLGSSLLIGICFSIPVILFNVCMFVFPALQNKHKFQLLVFFIVILGLFIGGSIYAYRGILPLSIDFLKSEIFFPESVDRVITYNAFLNFVIKFLLSFGVCFEVPFILLILLKIGIINRKLLLSKFKYFVIISFVLSAIITPPDIVSQILLACPLIVLYLLCILISKVFRIGEWV